MADGMAGERRRQKRGTARRNEIVAAAVEEFATYGFRGHGVAQVAKRVGLSEAGLFHHFGSKRELLDAVMRERHRGALQFAARLDGMSGKAAVAAMPEFMAAIISQPELAKLAYVLMAESIEADAPTHGEFQARRANARARLAGYIRAGIEEGAFRADVDADLLATVLLSVMDGVQGIWLLDPETVQPVEVMAQFIEMLERFLAPATAR